MKVVMIKHPQNDKIYWFEVPEDLADKVKVNTPVLCNTIHGEQFGIAVSGAMDSTDVQELMKASGASSPLRGIVDVGRPFPVDQIGITRWLSASKPSDEKLAKRFLEYYHHKSFRTSVILRSKDFVLIDGYTAYLAAKTLGLAWIPVFFAKPKNSEEGSK